MKIIDNKFVDFKSPFMTERQKFIREKVKCDIDILFLGDSITEGWNLALCGPTDKTYMNSGIGGDCVSLVKERLERDIFSYNPKQVVMMMGINDFLHRGDIPLEKIDETIEKYSNEYYKVVDTIIEQGIELICCSILKVAEIPYNEHDNVFRNFVYMNVLISKYNQKIKEYCKLKGIKYIDYNSKLENDYEQLEGSFTQDGIHLNQEGYLQMYMTLVEEEVL